MHLHVLLRFSDPTNPAKNTIEEHMKVLDEKGTVWWGKFGRGMADSKYEPLTSQIKESIPTYAFLYQGLIPRYKAKMIDIFKKLGGANFKTLCPEPELVPSYYRNDALTIWFKFDELLKLEETYDINKDYEREGGKRISLAGQTTLLFMNSKMPDTSAEFILEELPEDIRKMLPHGVEIKKDLSAVQASFSAALKESNISFGSRHDKVARSFIASLATKRFVILTGLSGSGKTQMAIKLGEWLGNDRSFVVPVRPDWTGSEALFGYEDAIQPCSPDGRRAWYVPEVLKFMLKAARDPQNPYLLVLDEMNIAHVERYFADVLSGMESMQPCLPNLHLEDENWRLVPGGKDRLPYPRNLFIVGTVNVDETTYCFLPRFLIGPTPLNSWLIQQISRQRPESLRVVSLVTYLW